MEVRYTLEGRDHWIFTKYQIWHAPEVWARWLITTLIVPVAAALFAWEWQLQPAVRLALIAGVSVAWLVYRILNTRRLAYKRVGRLPEEERQVSCSIAQNGLAIESREVDATFTWQNIASIDQTSEYIYLFFSRKQALIIPKRAFASPEEASAFYEAAAHFKKNAQDAPSELPTDTDVPADALAIDYNLTLEDYVQFCKDHRVAKGRSRIVILWFLLVPVFGMGTLLTVASFAGVASSHGVEPTLFVLGLFLDCLGAAIAWLLTPWNIRIATRRSARAHPGLIGSHSVTLLPESFADRTAATETRLSWNSLFGVVESGHAILIYQTAAAAFIIPKSAFTKPEDAITFLHTAREYLSRAKSGVYDNSGDGKTSWPPAPSTSRQP